jgi:hypothetical protein
VFDHAARNRGRGREDGGYRVGYVDGNICFAPSRAVRRRPQGVMGDLPGVRVLAGIPSPQGIQFVQGGCLSSHNGRELQISTPSSGNIVLE